MAYGGLVNNALLSFSVILVVSLVISEILKRYHITAVPFYIVAGVILGPYGLGLHLGEDLKFMGEIGLLFLVFMAGIGVDHKPFHATTALNFGLIFRAQLNFNGSQKFVFFSCWST